MVWLLVITERRWLDVILTADTINQTTDCTLRFGQLSNLLNTF